MFIRYWRTYPWVMQVFLFFTTLFTLYYFAAYLVLTLMPRLTGISFADLNGLSPTTPMRTTRIALVVQGILHLGMYTIPGLLFAAFAHPRFREYLGLRAPGKAVHWPLVTGIMLGLIPMFLWGEAWSMQHLHFGKWVDDLQTVNNNMTGAFLHLNSPTDLLLLLGVLALLPAIGEEIMFRGILLRLLHQRVTRMRRNDSDAGQVLPDAHRSMVAPVIFVALLFAVVHFNPHGLVFIFLAGCVLALIYFLTGSLLCSMWAHLLYNGLQIVAMFLSTQNVDQKKIAQAENLPIVYPLAGLLLFGICFYLLVKNQTPLPADWSDDFKGEKPMTEDPTRNIYNI